MLYINLIKKIMKKITFFFLLLTVSFGYSQVVLEDFDGATAPTIGFNNGPGSATIVADPATGGTNGNVLEIITGAASAPWQQAELTLQADYIDLSNAAKTVTVDVYSDSPFDMLARADGGVGGGPAATDASHGGLGWETLIFDFNNPKDGLPVATGIYQKIFFFNLWDSAANTGAGGWICPNTDADDDCVNDSTVTTSYVDNITAIAAPAPETCSDNIMNQDETDVDCGGTICGACPSPPTTPAPTPPGRATANVVSIYSDAYTDIGVDAFDAGWCGAPSISEIMLGSDAIQFMSLGCQGIDFQTNRQDLSSFDFLHFDIFTDEANLVGKVFNLKLVDFAGGNAEASALEVNINDGSSPGITLTGQWMSFDINISSIGGVIANNVTRTDIAQMGITSNLNGHVWYDNIYLHNNNLSTDEFETTSLSVYPNPTLNNWNISANTNIKTIAVYNILGKQVRVLNPGANEAVIDASGLSAGLYFAKVTGDNGSQTIKLVKK